jgi:hypothetical protein
MYCTRITALGTVLALPLGLAACSSHTKGSSALPAIGRPAASGLPQPGGAGSAPPGTAGPGSSAAPAGSGDFCTFLGKNNQILTDVATGDSRPGGVDTQKLKTDLQAEVDRAPAEIKPDIQTIVQFTASALDGKGAHETPQLVTAMQHYATWIASHCPSAATFPTDATS